MRFVLIGLVLLVCGCTLNMTGVEPSTATIQLVNGAYASLDNVWCEELGISFVGSYSYMDTMEVMVDLYTGYVTIGGYVWDGYTWVEVYWDLWVDIRGGGSYVYTLGS